LVSPLLEKIKAMGQPIHNRTLKFYSALEGMDVLIGKDPIHPETSINMRDIDPNFCSSHVHENELFTLQQNMVFRIHKTGEEDSSSIGRPSKPIV
jgi:hypothetical protein